MGVRYRINGRLLELLYDGAYTSAEVMATFLSALADPVLRDDTVLLFDLRKSDELARRSTDELWAQAELFGRNAEHFGRRCALLVRDDRQAHAAEIAISAPAAHEAAARIFESREEALAWLGVPDTPPATPEDAEG